MPYFRSALAALESIVYLKGSQPDPTKTYQLLCNGSSGWDDNANLADVLATELLEVNGYQRLQYRVGDARAATITIATDVITATGHTLGNDTPVFLFPGVGGTLPTLTADLFDPSRVYYVRDSSVGAGTLKLALTPGGVALDFSAAGTTLFIARAGQYSTANSRWDAATDTIFLSAAGSGITYDATALILDGSGWSAKEIASIDTGTSTITTTAAHGLATTDRAIVTTSSGGSLPGGLVAGQIYRVLAPSGSTLKLSLDGTATIPITTAGSGTLQLRNALGRLLSFRKETTAQTIAAGTSRPFNRDASIKSV
jgi:hypothetical protein